MRGAEGGGNRCYSFGGRGAADRGAEQSGSAFPQCGNGKGGDRLCSGGRFRRRGENHCKRLAENKDGDSILQDASDLQNIENVKGYETFVSDGKNGLTWQADGADIYYQGSTEKQLPVAVKLTYKLDGKEVKPEEIAGKSGRVTIRIDYEIKKREPLK